MLYQKNVCSLTQRTGLQFIPIFSTLKTAQISPNPPPFHSAEMELYEGWSKRVTMYTTNSTSSG